MRVWEVVSEESSSVYLVVDVQEGRQLPGDSENLLSKVMKWFNKFVVGSLD